MDGQFLDQSSKAGGNPYKLENDSTPKVTGNPGENAAESHGADLVYTDDSVGSYADIFDNAATKENPDSQKRVIRSLRSLGDLRDLEEHLDTREIVMYFAVHNFVGNYDSYTGPKPHNYLLYESDGKLALFPWDYNLAFGAFPSDGQFGHVSDSTWVINQGIDTPLVCVSENERPMWRWIVSDAAYLDAYHESMGRLISDCFDSGAFEKEIDAVHDMVAPYVEKDLTAYYSPEEFETAYLAMREIALLRAEIVRRQLAGALSTHTELQSESDRVEASQLSVKDMGAIEE